MVKFVYYFTINGDNLHLVYVSCMHLYLDGNHFYGALGYLSPKRGLRGIANSIDAYWNAKINFSKNCEFCHLPSGYLWLSYHVLLHIWLDLSFPFLQKLLLSLVSCPYGWSLYRSIIGSLSWSSSTLLYRLSVGWSRQRAKDNLDGQRSGLSSFQQKDGCSNVLRCHCLCLCRLNWSTIIA